jgi:hypothetical protein
MVERFLLGRLLYAVPWLVFIDGMSYGHWCPVCNNIFDSVHSCHAVLTGKCHHRACMACTGKGTLYCNTPNHHFTSGLLYDQP